MNYSDIVEPLLTGKIIKATKYISEKQIVRGTRERFGGKFLRGNITIVLTVGKPNYLEREFIKLAKKAGEPFPIKRIQVKPYEPKKNKLK